MKARTSTFNLKPFCASSAPVFVRHRFLITPFFPVLIVLVEFPIIWIKAVTDCKATKDYILAAWRFPGGF